MAHSVGLYLKNAAIGMLLVVPLTLLLLVAAGGNTQPPIIPLTEAEGYTFEVGSAALSAQFAARIDTGIAPRLARLALEYQCDVVEVIGHTDGQVVRGRSNLDSALGDAATRELPALSPGSNADLGLMRAWAVIVHLRRSPQLANLKFYGYSAAQMIDTSGGYPIPGDHTDMPVRRRIEIRLRRSLSSRAPSAVP